MNYQVIFDVAQTGYRNWGATLVSAVIFCAYPIVFQKFKGRARGHPAWPMLKFLNYLCVFGLFITLLSIGTRYPKYLRLESALRGSQCQVTTGVVSQFQHLYHQRHLGEGESFVVNGIEFKYREGSAQNGFNHVGIIQNGQQVRINYLGEDIARLEIAQ